jgi:hypothetical protein
MAFFTPSSRQLWLFVSATSYAATFCGFDDRLGAAEVSAVSKPATVDAYRSPDPPVESIVRRDPFAGTISSTYAPIADKAKGDVTVPDIVPSYADEIAFDQPPKTQAPALSVRATITGSHAVAYVEIGGTLTIVRVSDTVADRRVAAIDLRGLRFSDGTRLDLSEPSIRAHAPVLPRESKRPDTLMREFQRLRQLVLSRTSTTTNATATPPFAASQRSSDSLVTPGPLRTVDPRGIGVGTTPTPDAGAPTAFPIPYPYPPRPR